MVSWHFLMILRSLYPGILFIYFDFKEFNDNAYSIP